MNSANKKKSMVAGASGDKAGGKKQKQQVCNNKVEIV